MPTTTAPHEFAKKPMAFIKKNFGSPFRFRLALMGQLPMGFLSGMKIRELNEERCKVELKYKWLNKNPFKSTFWAVMGMAAEMSSGAIMTMYTYKQKPSIATILVKQEMVFHKKAVGKTWFICESGKEIAAAVREAIATGEGVVVDCPTKALNKAGELIAEGSFTWSFKVRSRG